MTALRASLGGTARLPVTFYDMTQERPHGFEPGHYFLFPSMSERGKTMVYGPYQNRRLAVAACNDVLQTEIAPKIFGV